MTFLDSMIWPKMSGSRPEKGPEVEILTEVDEEEAIEKPWRVILYDDDIHTFDEVINQLKKALGCSQTHAEELTFKVHNNGKAEVFQGSFEEAFQVNAVLQEIQLVTELKG